ncbi:Phospholipase/carboxylesterase [Fragilariopsis cylindrus CCMP1102]|uniref:Phospholipase/carboxylesterase n=1 Tax=Fragilariopsis cylindrus CCMP1102 TaxID=635003 RepID=A0A1E7ETJ6_9STRA|nr:Phospholipase/carboxylesterase [Fragilariopsis cylindrus CCMP1102]|eukprot:OEU09166.1 Phospholipase/carboxylesterase [Fragilariopsis cylindrus CCMP1102]
MSTTANAAAKAAASSSSSKYNGALIFLHGLGDTPSGWSHLQNSLQVIKPRLNSNSIKYVFPPAPIDQSITINGGATMPGWFDLYDWPIGVGSKDDRPGLMRSIKQIQTEVNKLINVDNIPANKIVIGGFSQGGAVALLACYGKNDNEEDGKMQMQPRKFAGCVGLSAWLTLPKEVIESGNGSTKEVNNDDVRKSIPLFWGHGTYDDKVLFEQQQFGIEALTNEFGLSYDKITSTQYPMGHESCSQEMNHLAEFLDTVLFDNEEENKNKSSEL